jgi:hypothetical protein
LTRPLALAALVLAAACTRGARPTPAASGTPAAPALACPPGAFPLGGACLADDDARRYCEKTALPSAAPGAGGCEERTCDEGAPVDERTGDCVPTRVLRAIAELHHVKLKEDAGVGCAMPEAGVRVEGESAACLARASTCGRGARWVAGGGAGDAGVGACLPDPGCPAGSLPDTSKPERPCVAVLTRPRVASGGGEAEARLDVGAWIRLALGNDGGEGTPAVCAPLQRRPWRAKVGLRSTAVIEVRVDLLFPDNDVSRARVTAKVDKPFDTHDLDNLNLQLESGYLDPVWAALRGLGGVSSAASARVQLKCTLDGGVDLASSAGPDPAASAWPAPLEGRPKGSAPPTTPPPAQPTVPPAPSAAASAPGKPVAKPGNPGF